MTEKYLHFLWRKKKIPTIDIKLTDGRKLIVIHFGYYNRNQGGPDFSMGIIHLDGTDLIGPIEMHVRSSDWYAHKHHLDPNYDNVILHVVYEHDRTVEQNGRVIPTLELRSMIDPVHRRNYIYGAVGDMELPCASAGKLPRHELEVMKRQAYFERIVQKLMTIRESSGGSQDRIMMNLLAKAFGTSVNREAFSELSERLPLSVIRSMNAEDCVQFVCDRSGFFSEGSRSGRKIHWEVSGMRPKNYPSIRIRQFAHCVALFFSKDAQVQICKLSAKEFAAAVLSVNTRICPVHFKLSSRFVEHLLINIFIAVLYLKLEEQDRIIAENQVVMELKSIRAEQNRITRMWKDAGVEIRNAYDSQSLLALNTYYCSRKKCLSCTVGKHLLNTVSDTENCLLL